METEKVSALILAAGEGERLGGVPKAFLEWDNRSFLEIAIRNLAPHAEEILVGLRAENFAVDGAAGNAILEKLPSKMAQKVVFFPGGTSRRTTFFALLDHARHDWILLHDVARPFTNENDFGRVLRAAQAGNGAAALGQKLVSRDGVGILESGKRNLAAMFARRDLVAVQTPQAYSTALIKKAVAYDLENGWDEQNIPALILALGKSVEIVWGESQNLKITFEDDAKLIEKTAREI